MAIKIDQKIVSAEVAPPADPVQMDERVQRPEVLCGETYKIKTPLSEHALYVTLNDVVLNPGSEQEQRRPFEIFINSKNMDHFQWIVALTRIVSAVFRKGGDVTFLAGELQAVFDPKGGYFKKGGKFMQSLVAEIGEVLETHLRKIGLAPAESGQPPRQADAQERPTGEAAAAYPPEAGLCHKCLTRAVVSLDGCPTCLACGDSVCG